MLKPRVLASSMRSLILRRSRSSSTISPQRRSCRDKGCRVRAYPPARQPPPRTSRRESSISEVSQIPTYRDAEDAGASEDAARRIVDEAIRRRAVNNGDNGPFLRSPPSSPVEWCNVTPAIADKVGVRLHRLPNHPLQILTSKIHAHLASTLLLEQPREPRLTTMSPNSDPCTSTAASLPLFDDLLPIVSTEMAFDSLRVPADHPSRAPTDTYYLDRNAVLRPHTSAHQVELLRQYPDLSQFLVVGDVYRRDEIDRSHYPVFHQMEGIRLFDATNATAQQPMSSDQILAHLQRTLEGLAKHLFGPSIPMRWVGAYFPFTDPSLELEIWFEGEWMEVLGCGVIHPEILRNAGRVPPPSTAPDGGGDADAAVSGWAFGLGLERWAMILFGIPDIRLFWSQDERFLSQFKSGDIVPFRPYSKYPPVYKDLSFWLPQSRTPPAYGEKAPSVHRDIRGGSDSGTMSAWHANDMYEAIRAAGGDLIEQVQLLDEFVHPKTNRISHCYRITWRSMDRNLTNEEIDELQVQVRERVSEELGVELR